MLSEQKNWMKETWLAPELWSGMEALQPLDLNRIRKRYKIIIMTKSQHLFGGCKIGQQNKSDWWTE